MFTAYNSLTHTRCWLVPGMPLLLCVLALVVFPQPGVTAAEVIVDSPRDGAIVTGVDVISGWTCEADTLQVRFNGGQPIAIPYGGTRGDTIAVCSDDDNGFSLAWNWALLGPGEHLIEIVKDGMVADSRTVTVVDMGAEFLTGASGQCTLDDFPMPGQSVDLRWQEPRQNFSIEGLNASKKNCSENALFYHDFNHDEPISPINNPEDNQWQIGPTRWWFPNRATDHPASKDNEPHVSGDVLLLKSAKTDAYLFAEEAQTLEEFSLPAAGEFIVKLLSARWGLDRAADAYWADSSVCLEIFDSLGHYGICFTFGSLGVFADFNGDCQDPEERPALNSQCLWAEVAGWTEISRTTASPITVRIRWETINGSKTFELFLNGDPQPRARLEGIDYLETSPKLRIRLNANVTDLDKLPERDADLLMIDYVCLREVSVDE